MRKVVPLVLLSVIVACVWIAIIWHNPTPTRAAIEPSLFNDLVSYWKLDEESGTRYDVFGGNDLTDNNTVGYTSGIIGNAADFISANNEYLSHSDNASLSTGDIDFTVSAWIVPDTDCEDRSGLVGKWYVSSGRREYLLFCDNNLFWFYVSYDGEVTGIIEVINTEVEIITNTEYFVLAWHDASNDMIGLQVNGGDIVTESNTLGVLDSTQGLEIGRYYNNYFDGSIDEVGFWKRLLTDSEKCALYNSDSGLAFPFNNPVPECDYIVSGDLGDIGLCDYLDDDTDWNVGNGTTISGGIAVIPPGGVLWNTSWPAADTLSIYAKTASWKQESVIINWMDQQDYESIYNNDTFHEYAVHLVNTGMTGTLTIAASDVNSDSITVTQVCRYSYSPVSPLPTPVSPLDTPTPQWDPWAPWQSQTDDIVPRAGSDDNALCSNGGNLLDNGGFEGGLWPWRCDWSDYRLPEQSSIWDSYGWILPNSVFSETTSEYYMAMARTRSYNYKSIGGCPAFGQYVRGLVPGTYELSYDVAIDGYGDSIPSSANVGGVIKRPGCVGEYCQAYSTGATTSLMDKDVLYPDYLTYRITDTIVIPTYSIIADNMVDNGNFEYGTTAWLGTWNIVTGGVELWGHAASVEYWMTGAYQDFAWPGGDMWVSVFSLSIGDSRHTIKVENTGTGEYWYLCNRCIHNYGQESYLMIYDAQAGTYRISLLTDTGTSHFDAVWIDSASSYSPPTDYFVGISNQHVQKPLGGLIPQFDWNVDEVSDLYLDNVTLCLEEEEIFDKQLYRAPLAPMGVPTDEPASYFCPLYEAGWETVSFFDDITPTFQSGDPGGTWVIPTWTEVRKLYWFNSGQEYDVNFRFGLTIDPDGGETSIVKFSVYTGTSSIVSPTFNVYQYMWDWPPPNITHVFMSIGANPSGFYWVSFYNTPSTWPPVDVIFDSLCFDAVYKPTGTPTPGGNTPTPTPTAKPTLTGTPTPYNTATPPPTLTQTPTSEPTRTPSPTGSTPTNTPTPPATNTTIPSPTSEPPTNTPPPTQSPSSTPQPNTPTPMSTNTPGPTPTDTPTAQPTRTPVNVTWVPPGPTPTPLSLPPSYSCMDDVSSITQWDVSDGVTLIEDTDYIYYARLNYSEYVMRPYRLTPGRHLLTYNARCMAYTSQSIVLENTIFAPVNLFDQMVWRNIQCSLSGWQTVLVEINAPVDGVYTIRIKNEGGGTAYYDIDVKSPCLVIEGEPWTPTPDVGTGTPTPVGTSTPVPSPTAGATPTWGPQPTATYGPGEGEGYTYSPPEAGFCDGPPPQVQAYGGYCNEDYAGNWWELPQLWLCLLWDLIQRLFIWLGQFLQWLLCPVFDILYWILCLVNTLATIAENLFCWLNNQWDFITGLWNGFWS